MPDDWYHQTLRFLHPLGAFVGFVGAPIALLSVKGDRRHVVAGRWFVSGMALGATAGILLSLRHSPPVYDLLYLGLITLSYTATGYLAPAIGRGSRREYRWDRVATGVGILASMALIWHGLLDFRPAALIEEDVVYGAIGLSIAAAHSRWLGPADPTRWRMEHLTSLLAAYLIVWYFVFALYIVVLPMTARVFIPAVGGCAGILWARRRFKTPGATHGSRVRVTAGAA